VALPCFIVATLLAAVGCTGHRPPATGRSETAERLLEEARQARDRGDAQAAEYLLSAAVDHNPGDGETRLELAEMLLAHGNGAAAAPHLDKFIDQYPDDPRGYVGLAEAMFLQQNPAAADELLEKAIELDPRHARGLLLRGRAEHARHDDERALEDFYQVLAFEPDHNEAKLLIADIHLQQGNAKLAAPLLRSVIDDVEPTNPQQAAAQWLLGRCYARDERWSDAARALEAGLASRRGSEGDWNEIAEACWRAGDTRGAGMAVAQALHIAPADSRALALRQAIESQTGPDPNYLSAITGLRNTPSPATSTSQTSPGFR
jgi:predicted Zn-dependent protease